MSRHGRRRLDHAHGADSTSGLPGTSASRSQSAVGPCPHFHLRSVTGERVTACARADAKAGVGPTKETADRRSASDGREKKSRHGGARGARQVSSPWASRQVRPAAKDQRHSGTGAQARGSSTCPKASCCKDAEHVMSVRVPRPAPSGLRQPFCSLAGMRRPERILPVPPSSLHPTSLRPGGESNAIRSGGPHPMAEAGRSRSVRTVGRQLPVATRLQIWPEP